MAHRGCVLTPWKPFVDDSRGAGTHTIHSGTNRGSDEATGTRGAESTHAARRGSADAA